MFWEIGLGVFLYWFIYSLAVCLIDCDLQLAICEKFGKSIGRLKGKVVFLTGASSGIGENTAYALAAHGVKLVLAARRKEELERVKQKCIELSNGALNDKDILVLPMDMCDLNSHKEHFDRAVRHFGCVDVLFNNAGRSQRATWENIEMPVDKEIFELNVFSVINLTRIAVNYFNQRGYGHVAATSSLAGVVATPLFGSYTASKHALHGYYNCLRLEKAGKGLTVSLFCPGPTFTNILQGSFGEKTSEKSETTEKFTVKRMSAERCGQLCALGIANKTSESWIALFPMVPFTYIAVYFPIIFNLMVKIVGPKKMFKLKDASSE